MLKSAAFEYGYKQADFRTAITSMGNKILGKRTPTPAIHTAPIAPAAAVAPVMQHAMPSMPHAKTIPSPEISHATFSDIHTPASQAAQNMGLFGYSKNKTPIYAQHNNAAAEAGIGIPRYEKGHKTYLGGAEAEKQVHQDFLTGTRGLLDTEAIIKQNNPAYRGFFERKQVPIPEAINAKIGMILRRYFAKN